MLKWFSDIEDRLETLIKRHRLLEKRIETLEQENASLKERLQALEDTVKTNKTVE
jgi:chaperonin cofactor prefoldin